MKFGYASWWVLRPPLQSFSIEQRATENRSKVSKYGNEQAPDRWHLSYSVERTYHVIFRILSKANWIYHSAYWFMVSLSCPVIALKLGWWTAPVRGLFNLWGKTEPGNFQCLSLAPELNVRPVKRPYQKTCGSVQRIVAHSEKPADLLLKESEISHGAVIELWINSKNSENNLWPRFEPAKRIWSPLRTR